MAKFIFTDPTRFALANAICEQAGIDPMYVRRMVIDLQVNHAGVIYVELLADDATLDVDLGEIGVTIKGAENDA